jgi:hypothetical protein
MANPPPLSVAPQLRTLADGSHVPIPVLSRCSNVCDFRFARSPACGSGPLSTGRFVPLNL